MAYHKQRFEEKFKENSLSESIIQKTFVLGKLIVINPLRVLLNPPTSDPPTTDHLPTDLPAHRPNDGVIMFKRLENSMVFTLQNINIAGKI